MVNSKCIFIVLNNNDAIFVIFFAFLETPLSLQSSCRLVIRKALGIFNLDKIDQLGMVSNEMSLISILGHNQNCRKFFIVAVKT